MQLNDLRTLITEAPMPPDPTWFMPYSLPPKGTGDDWSPMDGFEWVPVGDGYWQLVGPDGMPIGPPQQFPEGVDPNVDDGDPDYTPGDDPKPFQVTPGDLIPGGNPVVPDVNLPGFELPGGLPPIIVPGLGPISIPGRILPVI